MLVNAEESPKIRVPARLVITPNGFAMPTISTTPLAPTSLAELLSLGSEELALVDIGRANLLCAEGLPGAEDLDIEEHVARLDAWAERVRRATERHHHQFEQRPEEYEHSEPIWLMLTLTSVLQMQMGITYKQAFVEDWNSWNWTDSRDLLIHGLLGPTRSGTCSSLPVLYIAIGRRLGYPLRLVHAPSHAFCRWDGMDHANPAWREKRNFECHGQGMNWYPDEYYYTWPVDWAPNWVHEEQLRGDKRMYLRSLEPEEEVAASLCQRGHCLEAAERFDEAWTAYAHAASLAPSNGSYPQFCREVHKRKLAKVLAPWDLSPEVYTGMLWQRQSGVEFEFPWEVAGVELDAAPKDARFHGLTSGIADPSAAAEWAVVMSTDSLSAIAATSDENAKHFHWIINS